jgi:hypothetical protein
MGPDNQTPEIKFPSDALPVAPQVADKKPKIQMEYQKPHLDKPPLQFDTERGVENAPLKEIKEFIQKLQLDKMPEEGRRPSGPIKGSKGTIKRSSKKLQRVVKTLRDITLDDIDASTSIVPTKILERIRD